MMAAGSVSTPVQTDLEAAAMNASAVGDCSQSLPLPRGHLSRQLVAVLQPPKVPQHRSPCHALTMPPALLQASGAFSKAKAST
jgi:hypothetical protein